MDTNESHPPERTLCLARCARCHTEMQLVIVDVAQAEGAGSWKGRICPRCHHGLPAGINVTRIRLV